MHYNTDQLRDYQFGLLDPQDSMDLQAHLETCAECRAELENIKTQFSALDVLKDQPEVSENIVDSVLQIRPAKKTIPFRPAAILAAAASIAVLLGIFRPESNQSAERSRTDQARHSADGPEKPAAYEQASELQPAAKKQRILDVADHDTPMPAMAQNDKTTERSLLQTASTTGGSPAQTLYSASVSSDHAEPSLAELRAEKPFAPASNIELNVLPRRDTVQLTIYNAEDLTLVRETRKLTLKRGWNWLQFMWSNTLIDPTSLSLEPITHADQVEITQLVYPPRLNELARWTLFSEFSGEAEFVLTYFTSGLKWNAFYEATLSPDEQAMQLKSFVRVDNGSGEAYEKAQTRLVVGEINLEEKISELAGRIAYQPAPPSWYGSDGSALRLEDRGQTWDFDFRDKESIDDLFEVSELQSDYYAYRQKEVLKQALSEYQLYTIEGRETIPDGWGKRLPSFDVQEIGVTNLYKFDEERWGSNTMRFLSFANTEDCALGTSPLPDGRVRIYRTVPPDHLGYIGGADIKYIPVGEAAELELGPTAEVKAEPKLMRTRTDHYEFDSKGNISGWDEITEWEVDLANTRDLPVEVQITRGTGSYYWEVDTDHPHEKYDANHLRFTVQLEPRSRRVIKYELTVRHGSRRGSN